MKPPPGLTQAQRAEVARIEQRHGALTLELIGTTLSAGIHGHPDDSGNRPITRWLRIGPDGRVLSNTTVATPSVGGSEDHGLLRVA